MNNLPVAAALAVEGVERQFRPDRPQPVRPTRRPVRQLRVVIADGLTVAARAIAPRGYHLAH